MYLIFQKVTRWLAATKIPDTLARTIVTASFMAPCLDQPGSRLWGFLLRKAR
jgi:hypothetical protein